MSLRVYNAKYKNEFIETKENDGYKELIRWVFDKTFDFEQNASRDLFSFYLKDFKKFFLSRSINEQTALVYLSVFRNYMEWAMNKGYTHRSDNVLENISKEFIQEVSRKPKTRYLHVDEIAEITKLKKPSNVLENSYTYANIHNAQDRALIFLLFNGVMGEAMEELINLKKKDITFEEKFINIHLRTTNRDVKLSIAAKDIIQDALDEYEYKRYIALEDDKDMSRGGVANELEDNEYLFRKAKIGARNNEDDKMSRAGFQRRLVTMKQWLGLENFTANDIFRSGLIHRCKLFLDREIQNNNKVSISKSFFDKAFDQYDVSNDDRRRYTLFQFIKKELPKVYGEEYNKYFKNYNSNRGE